MKMRSLVTVLSISLIGLFIATGAWSAPPSQTLTIDGITIGYPSDWTATSNPTTSRLSKRPAALVWAGPRSLAATEGVEVSFLSCRYLDVSVPCVPVAFATPGDESWPVARSRRSPDHCPLSGSPKLFAAMPRPS